MIRDEITTSTIGKLSPPFDPISLVIDFLEDKLITFKTSASRFTEKGITQELFISYLNKCELPFFFDKEHLTNIDDGNSSSVDIAAILHADKECFFHIEAKRINQPTKNREKEYLFGKLGAVERFKKGDHGSEILQGNAIYLTQSAIIGYLVDSVEDFEHWQNLLNTWIDDNASANSLSNIVWAPKDKLISDKCKSPRKVSRYISNSMRFNKSEIKLYHLWVKLNFNGN